jgi:hypothetical protein
MSPPSEASAPTQSSPSIFERKRWLWPTVLSALIGIGLRLSFFGHPGAPYNPMMASFALLVPLVIGVVTVVTAERTARMGYYFWGSASANALCAFIAFLVTIEGLLCVVLAVPLFVIVLRLTEHGAYFDGNPEGPQMRVHGIGKQLDLLGRVLQKDQY